MFCGRRGNKKGAILAPFTAEFINPRLLPSL